MNGPKRCAGCGVFGAVHCLPFESKLIAGAKPGGCVLVFSCSAECTFQLGVRHAQALEHGLALEPDQMHFCETDNEAELAARAYAQSIQHREMRPEVRFACPFCGLFVDANTNPARGAVGLVHQLPMCSQFRELDPEAFMKACNRRVRN